LLLMKLIRFGAKDPGRLSLLIILAGILPLAINCMYMITTPESIHTLVLYGFASLYVLAVILADSFLTGSDFVLPAKALVNILSMAMAVIIVVNTYIANQAYLHLHLRYENASAFYTSLIADIKLTPGFDEDTKLAIIGSYQQPEFYPRQFEPIHTITGVYGFVPDNYSNHYFMEYYTGFPISFASVEEVAQIMASSEFEAMAVYPYYGSLQKIGNILVVKLS